MRQNWHLRSASVSTPSLLDMAVSSRMHLLSGPNEGQLLPHARVKRQLQHRYWAIEVATRYHSLSNFREAWHQEFTSSFLNA